MTEAPVGQEPLLNSKVWCQTKGRLSSSVVHLEAVSGESFLKRTLIITDPLSHNCQRLQHHLPSQSPTLHRKMPGSLVPIASIGVPVLLRTIARPQEKLHRLNAHMEPGGRCRAACGTTMRPSLGLCARRGTSEHLYCVLAAALPPPPHTIDLRCIFTRTCCGYHDSSRMRLWISTYRSISACERRAVDSSTGKGAVVSSNGPPSKARRPPSDWMP